MLTRLLSIALLSFSLAACTAQVNQPAPAPSKPALTPEQMQKNMQEAGAVRPEHALLKKLAGDWKVDAKFWMDPNAAPEVSKGTASAKLIYGGKYLVQNYKGSFMGKPFEGQGTMGFDNVNSKYFSTWIDSMNTMLMKSEGSAVGGNSIVLASAMTCPATREPMKSEDVITIIDNNHYRYEGFQEQNGMKIKGMEITYTRVK
jgi:hypothetical protein